MYETKDYEILQFKAGTYQDKYGNYWCDMALRGVGEPVRIAVKDPTKYHDGQTLYGTIESKTSQAGKDYLRFKKVEKPEELGDNTEPTFTKKEWQPRDDDAIRAQWAIGQAIQLYSHWNKERPEYYEIETAANTLKLMVDRVKNHGPKMVTADDTPETVRQKVDEVIEVDDEPINLNDIPF